MDTLTVGQTKIEIEISDDIGEQLQGLSNRESLCAFCGMVFVYDTAKRQNFWMKDMRFALDFVFIRDGHVVELRENVPPLDQRGEITRIPSAEEADMVLEVNAGFVRENSITVGDRASID